MKAQRSSARYLGLDFERGDHGISGFVELRDDLFEQGHHLGLVVVAREPMPPGDVPDEVVGEELANRLCISLHEGLVRTAHAFHVGML